MRNRTSIDGHIYTSWNGWLADRVNKYKSIEKMFIRNSQIISRWYPKRSISRILHYNITVNRLLLLFAEFPNRYYLIPRGKRSNYAITLVVQLESLLIGISCPFDLYCWRLSSRNQLSFRLPITSCYCTLCGYEWFNGGMASLNIFVDKCYWAIPK